MSTAEPVSIKILEKEYQIACPPEERADLIRSAEFLSMKMREIRDSGKVVGLDRIAVMAALNLANDLLKAEGAGDAMNEDVSDRVRRLREKVESALENGRQLEI